tara:strand:- start:100 stop:375 length:276 start_codon:yes stop_codon:yes gene_type:complete
MDAGRVGQANRDGLGAEVLTAAKRADVALGLKGKTQDLKGKAPVVSDHRQDLKTFSLAPVALEDADAKDVEAPVGRADLVDQDTAVSTWIR